MDGAHSNERSSRAVGALDARTGQVERTSQMLALGDPVEHQKLFACLVDLHSA